MPRGSVLALFAALALVPQAGAQQDDAAQARKLLDAAYARGSAHYERKAYADSAAAFTEGLLAARKLLDDRPELRILIDEGRAKVPAGSPDAKRARALADLAWIVLDNFDPAQRKLDILQWQALKDSDARIDRLRSANRLPELTAAYREMIAARVVSQGTRNGALARALFELGLVYKLQGDIGQAAPLLRRSAEILETLPREEHAPLPLCLDELAWLYQALARFDRAEAAYRRSLKVRDRLGHGPLQRSRTVQGLAGLYTTMGRYQDAQEQYRQALAAYRDALRNGESKYARDHVTCANDYAALLFAVLPEYAEAQTLLTEGRELCAKYCQNDARLDAQCRQYQAELYRQQGELTLAELAYKPLLTVYASDPLALATCLQNLAAVYIQMDRYDDAEPLYERCLKLREAKLGADHPEIALILNHFGILRRLQTRYEDAEKLLRRSLVIREKTFGKDHIVVANSLNQLAQLCMSTDRMPEAEKLYLRCLEIQRKALGEGSREEATTLDNLGYLYYRMGRLAQAETPMRDGLKIRQRRLAAVHGDLALSHNHLGLLMAARGKPAEAAQAFDDDRRLVRRYSTLILPQLTVPQQLRYFQAQEERQLAPALSLGLAFPDDADVRERVAGWLVNGKAVAHQVLAESQQRARALQSTETAALARELADVRKQLTRLVVVGEADALKRYGPLAEREERLAVQLRQQGGRLAGTEPWVSLAELRKALPKDAAFIDIARFAPHDLRQPSAERAAEHYVAWITLPAGPVVQVKLGEAKHIEKLVTRLRENLRPRAVREAELLGDGYPGAEQRMRKHLSELAREILHPLLPYVGKAKRWILCPDGDLWLVPWNALLLPDDRYAIEAHTIRFVTSGRDLVTAPPRGPSAPGAPLVLADPDFRSGARPAPNQRDRTGTRSTRLAAVLAGSIERLKGTAVEVRAARKWVAAYAHAEFEPLLREQATKQALVGAPRPSVLMLSTHGFFFPRDAHPAGGLDNPLLRCGLLLAGCQDPTAPEKGVLTGLEVVGLDLRGTDLVMLSACETALGEPQVGEGVAGLRQCFQLAGTASVVATLWSVPDSAPVEQVPQFFKLLAQGMDKDEALAQMQREQIKMRREEYGAAHPFYWAAFTVTGAACMSGSPAGSRLNK